MEGTTWNVQKGVSVVISRTDEAIDDPVGLIIWFFRSAHLELTRNVLAITTFYAKHVHSINGNAIQRSNADNPDLTKHLIGRNQHSEAGLCQSLWFHTGVDVAITQHVGYCFGRCHGDFKDGIRARLAVQEDIRQWIYNQIMGQIYTLTITLKTKATFNAIGLNEILRSIALLSFGGRT